MIIPCAIITCQHHVLFLMIISYFYIMTGLDIRHILAQNIKNRRKELGISQMKLAELAGLSAPYMNDIERCQTWVSDKTLAKLAKALLLDISMLFETQSQVDANIDKKENFLRFQKQKNKLIEYLNKSLDTLYTDTVER